MPQQPTSATPSGVRSVDATLGKVALVTGGGTGIGAATARRLAAEGARLVVTGRRAGPLEAIAAELDGVAVVGDAADPEHAMGAVRVALERFGGLDLLVANAGATVFGSVEEATIEDWHRAFASNIESALQFVRAAIPEFRKRSGGAVVLVASMAVVTAAPRGAPYMTSKSAMLGLNHSIAFDYGPENIRCNVVCHGWVLTEMAHGGLSGLATARGCTVEEVIARTTQVLPPRRMAQPEELGAVIAFLGSSDASFMSGSVIVVDGGASAVDAHERASDNIIPIPPEGWLTRRAPGAHGIRPG